jgi:hypothetical protein
MSLLAWLRRLAVSFGIGLTSYIIMLGIMVVSVLFDQQTAPFIKLASDAWAGHCFEIRFDGIGQPLGPGAVNHLRERVNMTHVVLSIPAVLIASLIVGVPLNKWLGGTRTALQRIIIALTSVPATVVLAVVLFSFNATFPDAYAALLRFADWVWQGSLNALSAAGDTIPGALKLTNVARQGFSGHHYVIMALCSMVASFLVNAIFAMAVDTRRDEPRPHEVA